jgi:pimeloyl-ACP methyl ester carboxylesterase
MATVVVSDDVEVFFSDHGRGPSVLMLHGWTCDGADWSWLAGDLAVDHRVVVPDLRGHGRSTRTVDGYGARTLVDDMVRLLGHLAIEHAVVVGHSMGAIVASVMAVEHPDMVSALVLVDPKYGLPDARAESLTAAMKLDPLKTARGIFDGFYAAESPLWQRVWHDRRLHGMPDSVTAAVFFAMFGSDTLG